jgi:hypothetical protein
MNGAISRLPAPFRKSLRPGKAAAVFEMKTPARRFPDAAFHAPPPFLAALLSAVLVIPVCAAEPAPPADTNPCRAICSSAIPRMF